MHPHDHPSSQSSHKTMQKKPVKAIIVVLKVGGYGRSMHAHALIPLGDDEKALEDEKEKERRRGGRSGAKGEVKHLSRLCVVA